MAEATDRELLAWLEGRVRRLARSLEGTDEGASVNGVLLDLEDIRAVLQGCATAVLSHERVADAIEKMVREGN